MNDLEITKACAEAVDMHLSLVHADGLIKYWPLTDDAQAMALVKKLRLTIEAIEVGAWRVENEEDMVQHGNDELRTGFGTDLNRAICECVAKMEKTK